MSRSRQSTERILFITRASALAALYVILTLLSSLLGLDGNEMIQVRISEALCVLPLYTSAAVPGITIGCFIYNLFILGSPIDAVFGTLATLIALLITRYIPFFFNHVFAASIPTVISNTLIIPFVVCFCYMGGNLETIPMLMLGVFIGEVISCSVLGTLLLTALKKHRILLFGNDAPCAECKRKKGNE